MFRVDSELETEIILPLCRWIPLFITERGSAVRCVRDDGSALKRVCLWEKEEYERDESPNSPVPPYRSVLRAY